jgi:hypothetical protein
MCEFINLKSVEDLEAFIQKCGFRQDPDNPDHGDFSEFRLITEDHDIESHNWVRYQYIPEIESPIDHKPIWEEIRKDKDWKILVEHDTYHCLCAIQPAERKILLFLFDYDLPVLFMIKLELLLNSIDFKRRLSRILGDYQGWGYDNERMDVMQLAFEISNKYDLGWVPPIDVRPDIK